MNSSKVLIERLERLSNKRVILCENDENNSNIFKPLKISERLESKRKDLVDRRIIIIDEKSKTLTFKDSVGHTGYLILCTFYKNYIIDIEGCVDLEDRGLSSIGVQFNNVGGYFDISNNKLTSLKGCPKVVGGSFGCNTNKLMSLEHCPRVVGEDFYCYNNIRVFTKEEVLSVCKVKNKVII
jgi:hypothetical protein